jgi:hypothetical protein
VFSKRAGSSSATSILRTKSQQRPAYQYVRDLTGCIQTLHRPDASLSDYDQSLGQFTDSYLLAHGFTAGAVSEICSAYAASFSVEDFVASVAMPGGISQREAEWLWDLIMLEN